MTVSRAHKIRTLWLAGVLHAFTHIYHVALMPLYLPMQKSFHLSTVGQSTVLVTILMISYFVPSYAMGILADRFNRKKILAIGLAINGLGFVGLGCAPNYTWAIVSMLVAGIGGSLFHPAATAMIARLFPEATGKALGFFGIGASVGFSLGPLYSGWRAEFSGWRAPVLELGAAGIIMAAIFYWLADEEKPAPVGLGSRIDPHKPIFPTAGLWALFLAACAAFGLRDFAGMSMGTLGSLFLQNAHDYNLKATGWTLSAIFFASALSNPLFGSLSDRSRLRWCAVVLTIASLFIALLPHLPKGWLVPNLIAYGFFFMASYPIIEAAVVASVPDAVRGRVFGIWITVGGLVGNLSHWLVGKWVQKLGPASQTPAGFHTIYGVMATLVLLSMLGLPCLYAVRRRENIEPNHGETAQPTVPLVNPVAPTE